MIDSHIRKFCESPRRNLIVVIATVVIGLLVLVPLVDDYFNLEQDYEVLADKLDIARQTAQTLPALESQVSQLSGELNELEGQTITEDTVSRYRRQLVELIRNADCRLGRLEVSAPMRRPWLENDDPRKHILPKGMAVKPTPFILERRSVTMTVDGTVDNIKLFLEQFHKDKTIIYPSRVNLHTTGRRGGNLSLELEVWLFALDRQTAT